jgi:hypothetical protein
LNPLVVEVPEIPVVLDLEVGSYHTLADVVGVNYDIAMHTRHRIKDAQLSGQPMYACAECCVPVTLLMHPESRRLYFKHTLEDGRCSAVTRGVYDHDEINARKYNGAKESRLHLSMKRHLTNSLLADSRFSNICVERRWNGPITGTWRKPDVQAVYSPPNGPSVRVAFEVQLSTTYLDVIVERRRFYIEQGGLLFWVFAEFNEAGRKLTQDDVFYNNNQNAFIVSEETATASVESGRCQLECIWAEPSALSAEPLLKRATIGFEALILDTEKQQAYYFDYYGRKEQLRVDELKALEPVRKAFEEAWIAADKDGRPVGAIWQEFYRGVRAAGIRLPDYPKDPHHIIISALYTAKHGRVIGWGFKKFIEVAHRVAGGHPSLLPLFRIALNVYGRGAQLQQEDKTGKWKRRVEEYKRAIAAKNLKYQHDGQYDEAVAILFPELFTRKR